MGNYVGYINFILFCLCAGTFEYIIYYLYLPLFESENISIANN